MTALLTLERAKLSRRPHRGAATTPRPAESVIGLRAGERMTVRRPAARAAAGQRQRRGGDARRARRRLAARASCALMNRRARAARADATRTTPTRSASTTPGNYSSADGPRQAHADPAAQRVLPRGDRPAARDAAHAARTRARSLNRNRSCARCPRSTASRPATRRSAGYVLVGSATQDGVTVISRRARRAQRGGARRRLARAHALRPGPLPPRARRSREGEAVRHASSSRTATSASQLVAARTVVRTARRGEQLPIARARRARASSTARCPRARGWGRSRSAGAGATSRACRSSPRAAIARGLAAGSAATTSLSRTLIVVILQRARTR